MIYSDDRFEPHEMDTTVEYKVWGEHAISGTSGAEVIDELKPAPADSVVSRARF